MLDKVLSEGKPEKEPPREPTERPSPERRFPPPERIEKGTYTEPRPTEPRPSPFPAPPRPKE